MESAPSLGGVLGGVKARQLPRLTNRFQRVLYFTGWSKIDKSNSPIVREVAFVDKRLRCSLVQVRLSRRCNF